MRGGSKPLKIIQTGMHPKHGIPFTYCDPALLQCCEKEPLRAASLISLRACRLQGASDLEKGEALRKFNHAKEAYEVLIDGTYIGLLSTTISLPSANHLIPWPIKKLSGLPLEMNVVLSWGIAEAAVDM